MQKCIFASHFPKENVQLCKNAFDAKMHLMQKCIFATRTFDFVKCSASHFTKSNVQHHIFQRKMFSCAKMLCFLLCKKQRCCAKMHLMQKCIFATHHILFCKNAFLHQQNVTNAFDAKMHLMQKCI